MVGSHGVARESNRLPQLQGKKAKKKKIISKNPSFLPGARSFPCGTRGLIRDNICFLMIHFLLQLSHRKGGDKKSDKEDGNF